MPDSSVRFGQKLGLGVDPRGGYRIGMKSPQPTCNVRNRDPLDGRARWISGGLVVAAALGLWIDPLTARWLNVERLPGDIKRILGLTEFFAHGVGVAFVAWCIWQMAPTMRRCLPRLLACAILPGLAANLLKLTVARLRPGFYGEQLPTNILDTWVGGFIGVWGARGEFGTYFATSFPSGHAATAFGMALGLCWMFHAGRGPFLTLAIFSSVQRISHASHWFSDTLIGVALATAIAGSLVGRTGLAGFFARFEAGGNSIASERQPRRAA
jgi:membrane-associated phospholipid phosphatase